MTQQQFFLFVPTTHEFDLEVNFRLKSFESDLASFITDVDFLPEDFFKAKLSIKTLKLDDDIKT